MPLSRRRLFPLLATLPLLTREPLLLAQPPAADVPKADPDQWFWFPGHNFCMKSTGADTGGKESWLLADAAPRSGVPFHKHRNEDEAFYVVEGTFEISVADRTVQGGPGTFAFGPREVPHRWTNIGDSRGRILNVFTPAGFEAMFYEIGLPIANSSAPPPQDPRPLIARMAELSAKYGNTRTGDFRFHQLLHPGLPPGF